jgi:hypothetical protein
MRADITTDDTHMGVAGRQRQNRENKRNKKDWSGRRGQTEAHSQGPNLIDLKRLAARDAAKI